MKIALIGDIGLFGGNTLRNQHIYEKMHVIKEYLSSFDYVIGNLETPLTHAEKTIGGKSAYIKGNPEDVNILRYLGITHVSLANNHICDYNEKGVEDTIRVLDENGIKWYGLFGKSEYISGNREIIRLRGYCCYSTNGKRLGTTVNLLDPRVIDRDLEEDKNNGCITILSLHWGQEHTHYPNYDHIMVAHKMLKNRTCIIHGHHPHVLQGIEEIDKSIVAYSLGNFCFDDIYTSRDSKPLVKLSEANKQVAVLGISIDNNRVENYKIDCFVFDDDKYEEHMEILQYVDQWSAYLKNDKDLYIQNRQRELNEYLSARKKRRDLKWYIKRLNVDTAKMIISARDNKAKYVSTVGNYIDE